MQFCDCAVVISLCASHSLGTACLSCRMSQIQRLGGGGLHRGRLQQHLRAHGGMRQAHHGHSALRGLPALRGARRPQMRKRCATHRHIWHLAHLQVILQIAQSIRASSFSRDGRRCQSFCTLTFCCIPLTPWCCFSSVFIQHWHASAGNQTATSRAMFGAFMCGVTTDL